MLPTSCQGSVDCDTCALGCIFFFFLMPGGHPFGDEKDDKKNNIGEGTAMNINRKCTLVIYRCRSLPPFMISLYR